MKFMVAVDLEGLACVVGSPGKSLSESSDYLFACRQGTREADAAARALFDSGADEVYVWDNHGESLNLDYENLDRRCKIIAGCGELHRWPGLDHSFSGLLMIGYHAMDNTSGGVLSHTYNSQIYQWIKINGVEAGEIAIDAAVAGECFDLPVIFVSSDDHGADEARKFLPWAETVITKTGLGRNLAICKHPQAITSEIYDGVTRSVSRIADMKAFKFETPVEVQIRFKRMEDAERACSDYKWNTCRTDAYTVMKTTGKISDLY